MYKDIFRLRPVTLRCLPAHFPPKTESLDRQYRNNDGISFNATQMVCSEVKEFVTLCTMNRDLLILSEQ